MARKKKSKKNKNGEEYENELGLGLSQETKNGIYGVIAFGLGILSVLAFFDKAGTGGEVFQKLTTTLFGIGGSLIFALVCVLIGISFFKAIHSKIHTSAVAGTILFVLSLLAIFYIFGGQDLLRDDRLVQGGWTGWLLGSFLLQFVGIVGAWIILLLVLLVSVLVVLDIPIHALIFKSKEEEENEEKDDEECVDEEEIKDKVVIKRGAQVLDIKEQEKSEQDAILAEAKRKSQKEGDKSFVIKSSRSRKWTLPPLELLQSDSEQPRPGDINANVQIIKRTLSNFGITVEMGEVSIGPSVTQFTLRPAVGVKLARITALAKDLALALAASSIRIEAPIPGKALVGIEIPNAKSAIVGLRDLLEDKSFAKSKSALPLAIGRDVSGFAVIAQLEKMPHLLIAGSTGSGKSVTINTILLSLLYKHSPDMLKFILVDPKRVELTLYNDIPHLITPVIVDTKKVIHALRWAVKEMERRYEKLSEGGSRDLFSYNEKRSVAKESLMPFIVIVIDELADLMAAHGRDVEAAIVRLAQMARAVGIHLIVSTQRPSVEVITGLIKANISSRIALRVASQIDSRTILDNAGAEKLLGHGDMLYLAGNVNSNVIRVQGTLVTEKEVKDVVKFIRDQGYELVDQEDEQETQLKTGLDSAVSSGGDGDDEVDDDMYVDAKQIVIESQKASASYLQRRLRVGYARAARLLDLLEEKRIIGPGEGAKPREVYVREDGITDNPEDDLPKTEEYEKEENYNQEEVTDRENTKKMEEEIFTSVDK